MGIVAAFVQLAGVVALATCQPAPPLHPHEAMVHTHLFRTMGVAERLSQSMGQPARFHPANVLPENHYEGMRVKVFSEWVDDPSRTCQPFTTNTRLGNVAKNPLAALNAGGFKRCPEGTIPIETPTLGLVCAEYNANHLTRHEAAHLCEQKGGFLVPTVDDVIPDELGRFLRLNGYPTKYWIGLRLESADTTPLHVEFDNGVPATAWSERWNANPSSPLGKVCCVGLDTAVGDPTCFAFDDARAVSNLHPYLISDCGERASSFCSVPPEIINPSTDEAARVTTKDPLFFFAPTSSSSITYVDRTTGSTKVANCTSAMTMGPSKKALLARVVRKVTRYLNMLLAPKFQEQGDGPIQADEYATITCGPSLTFDLRSIMVPPRHVNGSWTLPKTDLLIILTTMPDWTTAYSFPCKFGSDQRPTVILLNVSPNKLGAVPALPRGMVKLRNRLLQAAFHSLGFHETLFPAWKQPVVNRTVQSASCSAVNTQSCRNISVIVTPHVKKFIETHQFLCEGNPSGGSGRLVGAELEDGNVPPGPPEVVLGYWEKRIFKGEIMTLLPDLVDDFSNEVAVVSGLTIAAFKDMGWYVVNDVMAQELPWGLRQRCEFASQDCTMWSDRFRCSGNLGPQALGCSPDFLSLAACNVVTWPSGEIPTKFRWLGANRINEGGKDALMDWCLIKDPANIEGGSCIIEDPSGPNCQLEPCRDIQVRGQSSRCFETTLRYKEFENQIDPKDVSAEAKALRAAPTNKGTCLPHRCELIGQGWLVHVYVGGQSYTCGYKGQVVGPSHRSSVGVQTATNHTLIGQITCPDPAALCLEGGEGVVREACDPIEDCNGNGFCQKGQCVCFNETNAAGPIASHPHIGSRGFFGGEHCERCADGYYGWPECKQRKCPVDPRTRVMCFGNGVCDGNGTCKCYADRSKGFWNSTTGCRTCATGYTGGGCTVPGCTLDLECGQGSCDVPTGRCRCFSGRVQGYWAGTHCDRCRDGYDIAKHCRSRISNYFACDVHSSDDILRKESTIDCSECAAKCAVDGRYTECMVPKRIPHEDMHGCVVEQLTPRCSSQPSRPCSGCPLPEPTTMDCQGYPLLFTTCWVADKCGCLPASFIVCERGTDAWPAANAYDQQFANVEGAEDPRPQTYVASSEKRCECPDPHRHPPIDCWGPLANPMDRTMGPAYYKGRVVFFEPRRFQIIEEDFCHCTSPPIPTCSDETKPYHLKENAYGVFQDCTTMLEKTGCPNWDLILNINHTRDPEAPDLSIMDCGGWPAPKLRTAYDPCGCPFPQFRCKEGTRGVCEDPPECPKWPETLEVDCKGREPPVLTLHADHPCGCPPPPKPSCIEGTGPCCKCDRPEVKTIWVDCRGSSLDPPLWDPEMVYPRGDPWIQPCDACPQCIAPPPVRRCIEGSARPRPRSPNKLTHCPGGRPNLAECPVLRPPCPIDCAGSPPPPPADEYECACPPPPPPACLPGTYGLGSVVDRDFHPSPCSADPSMCQEYACGGEGLEDIAVQLGIERKMFRSCTERERAWTSLPGTRYCLQSCSSDLGCACGFKCSVCGICIQESARDPSPGSGNCLLDGGRSCGAYACTLSCGDVDSVRRIKEDLVLEAVCKTKCLSNADCQRGAICTFPKYSPSTAWGLGHQEDDEDVLEREHGQCLFPEDPELWSTELCYSHDECGGYACGTDHKQVFFSNSRCRSTCWVNGHCHPDFRCSRATGRCVRYQSAPPDLGECRDDPSEMLSPFGGCDTLVHVQGLPCESDLSTTHGLAVVQLMTVCPVACKACPLSTSPKHRRAQTMAGCTDDPAGNLTAYGATPALRCQAVVSTLKCEGDISNLDATFSRGTIVNTLCPLTCGVCQPTDPNTREECADGHDERPGDTSKERCLAAQNCCYIAEYDLCSPCQNDLPPANPAEQPEPAGGELEPDSPSCEKQPFDFCAPYVCGGHRGLFPRPGAVCGTSCVDDDGCQPFHRCYVPTIEELIEKHVHAPTYDPVTGVLLAKGERPNSFLSELNSMKDASAGTCVPDEILKRRKQTTEDLEDLQRTHPMLMDEGMKPPRGVDLPMLRVPVGHLGGQQEDAHTVVFLHPPFSPPPPPPLRELGTAVKESSAECFPYTAASTGITEKQLRALQESATSGTPERNTGVASSLPGCKTSCVENTDCAAGYFCTRAAQKETFISKGGEPVVDDPACSGPTCLGSQEEMVDPLSQLQSAGKRPLPRGQCRALRGLGTACTRDFECGTHHCVKGICCNTACDAPCQTCTTMGICSWVAVHTDPDRNCGVCEWCDYVVGSTGGITPATPLACVPIPFGKDVKGECGIRGVCNGEGGCTVLDPKRGGQSGETCALGLHGPNCESQTTHYHTITVEDTYKTCDANDVALLSQSPVFQSRAVTTDTVVRDSSKGFVRQQLPHTTAKSYRVADRRPRQWAQRVLGLSEHSQFGCSEILYEPSLPPEKRVHGLSEKAWAPRQLVRRGGHVEHPELEWNPFLDCRAAKTQTTCRAVKGCQWMGEYCTSDGTIASQADAEDECMAKYECGGRNASRTSCQQWLPRCKLVLEGPTLQFDKSRLAPPPTEWIELEFKEAVYVEAVLLHENFNPGSLVKIELQPALEGSAALAASGGGALQTDSTGAEVSQALKAEVVEEVEITTRCGTFTPLGDQICQAQEGCTWELGACIETSNSCDAGEVSCKQKEKRGECYWDNAVQRCYTGLPCLANPDFRKDYEYCSTLNDTACPTMHNGICEWQQYVSRGCSHWNDRDECNKFTDRIQCEREQRGVVGSLVQYCYYNATSRTCHERPELFKCESERDGTPRSEASCNSTRGCSWSQNASSGICLETAGFDCGTLSNDRCVSCAFRQRDGCAGICSWDSQTISQCVPFNTSRCSSLEREQCSKTTACKWVGSGTALSRTFRSLAERPQ
eukprot:Sspe_Gene.12594::Locus_4302_Transcript_1_1_Confidence_1.000_Length_8807::g.12594::m.12594